MKLFYWILFVGFIVNCEAWKLHKRPSVTKLRPIVGGERTDIKNYPHQVSMARYTEDDEGVVGTRHSCGGSIISVNWVLTAAHCISTRRFGHRVDLVVRVGTSTMDEGGSLHNVTHIIEHPDYEEDSNADMALLQVTPPFEYGPMVKPIRLNKYKILPGKLITVTGWGLVNEGGRSSKVLKKVQVPVVPQWECKWLYGDGKMSDLDFCAGQAGRDSCRGDSGGPAVYQGRQVGVVSRGLGCGRTGYPGLYAAVHMFLPWIHQHTGL